MPPSNRAAYLTGAKIHPLAVKDAPYTPPKAGEITIRNRAIGINPIDYIKQGMGDLLYGHIKYPGIIGWDVAGEVVEVGPGVTRFKVGDRVVGLASGMAKSVNQASQGAFQEHVVLLTRMTAHIPDRLPHENACALPLGISTAACGLFQKDQLGLQHPTSPAAKSTGQTVLIWGGSTSVGCNAIQLATAAGYEVITTCSPRNNDLVKRLGAIASFDYRSPTVVADIKKALAGKTVAGAMSIGDGAAELCIDILGSCTKGNKSLALASFPLDPHDLPTGSFVMPRVGFMMVKWMGGLWVRAKRNGVKTSLIQGDTLIDNEVGPAVFEKFLGEALAKGEYIAMPESEVVGHGLEKVQEAMDLHRKGGVSAKKIVVTL
jgi:NADPH:quinone reductase-like Zn-dependent oxidoreductase